MLGSVLQWAQSAVQARRERRREQQSWSREDRRVWAEKRQTIYLETIASARRQFMSLEGLSFPYSNILGGQVQRATGVKPAEEWRRPEVLAEWNRLLAEVEFHGSDEVRAATAALELAWAAFVSAVKIRVVTP